MKNLLIALLILPVFALAATAQTTVETHINKSHELAGANQFTEALAEIDRAIEIEPRNPRLYLKRANITEQREIVNQTFEFETFIRDLLKAIDLAPNDLQNYLTAIHLLLRHQICEPALNVANQAVLRFPSEAEVFAERARTKTCTDDLDGAMTDFEKAISLDPLNDMHKHNRANLLRLMDRKKESVGSYTEQITAMELRLQAGEESDHRFAFNLSGAYISRSRIYAQNGEIEKAFADLDRAVAVHPIHYTYLIRARAYKSQKRYPEALADLNKAIELEPDNASLYIDRGDLFVLLEKFEEAIRDFEFALNSGRLRPVDFIERRIADVKKMIAPKATPEKPE